MIDIEQKIKQMLSVLRLWQGKRNEWAKSMVGFINRNWQRLSWHKRYPEKEIENTNNGAEIINFLFKPHYKDSMETKGQISARKEVMNFLNCRGLKWKCFFAEKNWKKVEKLNYR